MSSRFDFLFSVVLLLLTLLFCRVGWLVFCSSLTSWIWFYVHPSIITAFVICILPNILSVHLLVFLPIPNGSTDVPPVWITLSLVVSRHHRVTMTEIAPRNVIYCCDFQYIQMLCTHYVYVYIQNVYLESFDILTRHFLIKNLLTMILTLVLLLNSPNDVGNIEYWQYFF